jgi:hypothetical protein
MLQAVEQARAFHVEAVGSETSALLRERDEYCAGVVEDTARVRD